MSAPKIDLEQRAFEFSNGTAAYGRILTQRRAMDLAREYAAAEVARVCEEIADAIRGHLVPGDHIPESHKTALWWSGWACGQNEAERIARSFAHPPAPKTREQALEEAARATAQQPCEASRRPGGLSLPGCECFSCRTRRALAYRPEAADAL